MVDCSSERCTRSAVLSNGFKHNSVFCINLSGYEDCGVIYLAVCASVFVG